MNPQLPPAIALHRAGRLAEAQAIYRQVLAQNPNDPDALHLLGLVACQSTQLDSALDLISRALAFAPDNVEFLTNLGEVQRRLNRLPDAIVSFERAIALSSQSPAAHYNLAVAHTAASHIADAIAAYRTALSLQPAFLQALNNLGILLSNSGQLPDAVACFRSALALSPDHAEVLSNLGLALWRLDQHDEALSALTRALERKPTYAPAQINLAYALRKLGRHADSVAAYRRAAELAPGSANVHRDLAQALLDARQPHEALASARRAVELAPAQADAYQTLGIVLAFLARTDPQQTPAAIAAYEQALSLDPNVPEWQFELANLRGATPATAPDAYIKALFDEYALRFDHHLLTELRYRVPHDLLALVQQLWRTSAPVPQPPLDILDLGCGTGLCGQLFQAYVRSLVGVDLSPNMIAMARKQHNPAGRPLYDTLYCDHLLPVLQQHDRRFDLILAADVFIYVGALDQVLPAASRALRPGGLLALSLERHDGPEDFILHHRFAHNIAYIRHLAQSSHLAELLVQPATLRTDVPPGWIVLLQRSE